MITHNDEKKNADELAVQLKKLDSMSAIDLDNEQRNIEDFINQLSMADDLPVIDQEHTTTTQNNIKTCKKCKEGKLQREKRTTLEKLSFVKRKYVCDFCADGVYIRRYNGN